MPVETQEISPPKPQGPQSGESKWAGPGTVFVTSNNFNTRLKDVTEGSECKDMHENYMTAMKDIIKSAGNNPTIAIGVKLQKSGAGHGSNPDGTELSPSYLAATSAVKNIINSHIPDTCARLIVVFSSNCLQLDQQHAIEAAAKNGSRGRVVDILYLQEYKDVAILGKIGFKSGEIYVKATFQKLGEISLKAEDMCSVVAGNPTENWAAEFFKESHPTY